MTEYRWSLVQEGTFHKLLLLLLGGLLVSFPAAEPVRAQTSVDDFESYSDGTVPSRWKFVSQDKDIVPLSEKMKDGQRFRVVAEDGNQFLRAYTQNEAFRITQRNGEEFNWNLKERPYLQWEWRANQLPEGASEKGENDTGGAVYVTYGEDWLGRPKSIKYTYSSTLPVGTTVDFGPLTALVVASGAEGTGSWKTETRNVAQDIRNVVGDDAPKRPVSITIWSDTDSTGGTAEVDFDDFRLLSQP
jgi:hypothetical protein